MKRELDLINWGDLLTDQSISDGLTFSNERCMENLENYSSTYK